MIKFRDLINTITTLIAVLDSRECLPYSVLGYCAPHISSTDLLDVVLKMQRGGLIVTDTTLHADIVSITPKGRMLAADIRAITTKRIKT